MSFLRHFAPEKNFSEYLAEWDRDHTRLGTKLVHMLSVPMILFSLPLMVSAPFLGAVLFATGSLLETAAHYCFERTFRLGPGHPLYLAAGAVWVAREFELLLGLQL